MDAIEKNQAKPLAYVFSDFCDQFTVLNLWSDYCSAMSIETRDGYKPINHETVTKLSITKISLASLDNIRIFREMKNTLRNSPTLQVLQLTGFIIRREGWQCLADGVKRTKTLNRLIVHSCNLAEGKNFDILSKGLWETSKVDYFDVQCNDLSDKHIPSITQLIKAQYEYRDGLQWRLGLRNDQYYNISTLGVKFINLGRNNFTDAISEALCKTLQLDKYIRCISLQKNKLTELSFKKFA